MVVHAFSPSIEFKESDLHSEFQSHIVKLCLQKGLVERLLSSQGPVVVLLILKALG